MVLDISVAEFFGHVGHDGSEIAFPMLPDPMARRGLHIQECIAACMKLGYAVTPIELFPVIQSTPPGENNIIVLFGDDKSANWRCFEHTIQTTTGVLEGVGRRCLHAVAYHHGVIFDPDGDEYPYSHPACDARGFHPRRAWRVDCLPSFPRNPLSHNSRESIPTIPKDSPMKLPYDHGLTNKITLSSDHERNERLYPRVMAGDEKAREEMIEGNMPLVVLRVNSFVQRNPQLAHLRDDLHSAGFTGLVQAVNKMAESSDIANPNSYISVAISREIAKLAEKEAVHIGIELMELPANDPPADADSADCVREASHGVPESIVDGNQSATTELIELRDLLQSCCESEEERTLLRMREEGHSDRDIAEVIGQTLWATHTLRKRLEERFNQKCRELEE